MSYNNRMTARPINDNDRVYDILSGNVMDVKSCDFPTLLEKIRDHADVHSAEGYYSFNHRTILTNSKTDVMIEIQSGEMIPLPDMIDMINSLYNEDGSEYFTFMNSDY